jgi:hypothetical protein
MRVQWNADEVRRGEKVALRLGAAFGAQPVKLLLTLNAFGCGHHSQTSGEVNYGPDNVSAIFPICQFTYEAPVDLNLVEGEGSEIIQRRIARAEIMLELTMLS